MNDLLVFSPMDAPPGLVARVTWLGDLPLYAIAPEAHLASAERLARRVAASLDDHLARAAAAVRDRWPGVRFGGPEVVCWEDEAWMVRFAEVDGLDAPCGLGVEFLGDRPGEVAILVADEALDGAT